MFSIVISEKGGAERREVFDKAEINVGRVQGNDLLLPKGNVSKRHARLLLRDGRFIVTDLKSTNGTYVNGRKIMQATIVREGDKIYVGDFVLKIDSGTSVVHAPHSLPMEELSSPTGPTAIPPQPSDFDHGGTSRRDAPSFHSVPDLDVSDATGTGSPRVPSPPRLPGTSTARSQGIPSAAPVSSEPTSGPFQPPPVPLYTVVPRPAPASPQVREQFALYVGSLTKLVDRVAEMIDLAPLDGGAIADEVLAHRIERAIREQIKTLRDDQEIPETADLEALGRDAQREVLGMGPMEQLLEDPGVAEIHVLGHDRIVVHRGGHATLVEHAFSTDRSLRRVIARLCREAGHPLLPDETVIERRLARGAVLYALAPPLCQDGHVLVLRKERVADITLEDLVRSGTISRAMATFLIQIIGARGNILVVGASAPATASLACALAQAGGPDDKVVALQLLDELAGVKPSPIRIALSDTGEVGASIVRAAAKLDADRFVVSPFAGRVAAEVISAISEGAQGVIATLRAPSLRHALERLAPDLVAARPGLGTDAARTWLASSFDIALEVATLRDGRHRVLRVAEILGADAGVILAQDIFSFVVERTAAGGALEGLFCASGIVPRLAEDLGARGSGLDPAVFKRTGR